MSWLKPLLSVAIGVLSLLLSTDRSAWGRLVRQSHEELARIEERLCANQVDASRNQAPVDPLVIGNVEDAEQTIRRRVFQRARRPQPLLSLSATRPKTPDGFAVIETNQPDNTCSVGDGIRLYDKMLDPGELEPSPRQLRGRRMPANEHRLDRVGARRAAKRIREQIRVT